MAPRRSFYAMYVRTDRRARHRQTGPRVQVAIAAWARLSATAAECAGTQLFLNCCLSDRNHGLSSSRQLSCFKFYPIVFGQLSQISRKEINLHAYYEIYHLELALGTELVRVMSNVESRSLLTRVSQSWTALRTKPMISYTPDLFRTLQNEKSGAIR